jgi:hypothetical protein
VLIWRRRRVLIWRRRRVLIWRRRLVLIWRRHLTEEMTFSVPRSEAQWRLVHQKSLVRV